MAKRFTDTTKWSKTWFMKLSPKGKLLWQFLCDSCTHFGIWEENYDLASCQIGLSITREDLSAISKNIVFLDDQKIFIPSFIEFQYGKLDAKNRVHTSIIRSLEKYGIDPSTLKKQAPYKGLISPIQGAKEKDKEKDKDMEKDKSFSPVLVFDPFSSSEEGGVGETKRDVNTRPTWDSFTLAYRQRWKTDPLRNQQVNCQMKNFVRKVGVNNAPQIAEFYVGHNDGLYVKSCHSVGLLLRDSSALHTQWTRGRAITGVDIRTFEKSEHTRSQLDRIESGEL